MSEYIQILTTVGSKEDAEEMGRSLVENRLAACVQILGPITSIYRWEGKIERAEEWQCLAKTQSAIYRQVEQAIRELHDYDVPEILSLPIAGGNPSYLEWVRDETGSFQDPI